MRYVMIAVTSLLLVSCSMGKTDPSFDIHAHVKQHSIDPNKGIHLVIYPVDREGEK